MVCVPTPAVLGSKSVPVTPLPENVPPAGLPTKVTTGASTQRSATGSIVGVGNPFTVMSIVVDPLHPPASV